MGWVAGTRTRVLGLASHDLTTFGLEGGGLAARRDPKPATSGFKLGAARCPFKAQRSAYTGGSPCDALRPHPFGRNCQSIGARELKNMYHCPETNPNPEREKHPKCSCLGPGRLRKSTSVGVRVSFGVVNVGCRQKHSHPVIQDGKVNCSCDPI